MDMLRAHPQAYGVLHSFSGSHEMAEELVRMGYYVSFSGTLTFKNARRTVECAQRVPRERILIETDAPYLCPHPHRGELNHSGRLSYTCARLAELLGIREAEAAALTAENARRLFRL
jgi:TatD DNase family protein